MTRRSLLLAVGVVLALGGRARASEDRPAATPTARPDPGPVRAGKTTVTVIDENETVDDVVTRVRADRGRQLERRNQPVVPGGGPGPGGERQTGRAGAEPGARSGAGPAGGGPLREAIRERRAAGERPGSVVRERIRERLNERKAARPRAEQPLRRQRAR
jgi:hypothetical protein